jgi:hypothetical protein
MKRRRAQNASLRFLRLSGRKLMDIDQFVLIEFVMAAVTQEGKVQFGIITEDTSTI